MSIKKYLEHHVQLHTLRVELMSGKFLRYGIDAIQKEELEKWLDARTDDLVEFSDAFVSFYAHPDRMIFVRISAVKRLIFCWDPAALIQEPLQYEDPFAVAEMSDDGLAIPAIIIKMKDVADPLVFWDVDPEDDFLGISEHSLTNHHFLTGGFISLPDEDGEQNYIPVCNIECLDLERIFIYPDDLWREMEDQRDIQNRQN